MDAFVEFLQQLQLLRPLWLLALLPALGLFLYHYHRRLTSKHWQDVVDDELMPYVLEQQTQRAAQWPLWGVMLAWTLSIIALSGPSWERLPQPVQKQQDALVILLDMSLSMAAQDVKPDRTTRARQKVIDIVSQRQEGLTALIAYAGDAHTVSPFTDDSRTLQNLVPALSPFIMPLMGSRPDKALALARNMVRDNGLSEVRYLLITDGIRSQDIDTMIDALDDHGHRLSVLVVGTADGAPIALPKQGFLRDGEGSIVLPKLELGPIKALSRRLGTDWQAMSYDDSDWQALLTPNTMSNAAVDNPIESALGQREYDQWVDRGYWLLIAIMVIAALSYRQGWLLTLVLAVGITPEPSLAREAAVEKASEAKSITENAESSLWQRAWKTGDQRGAEVFEQSPAAAAQLFEDPEWRAASHYRSKDYQGALDAQVIDDQASSAEQARQHYNRGNALAQSQSLDKAAQAYRQALTLQSDMSDARFNLDLVERLMEQQQKQDQDSQQQEGESDSQQKNSEQQDGDQKKSGQQDSKPQDSKPQDSKSQGEEQQSPQDQGSKDQDSDAEADEAVGENKEEGEDEAEQARKAEQQDQSDPEQPSPSSSTEPLTEQPKEQLTEQELEQQQALKQWLNRVPDDPGGLLRRKFLYQYQQQQRQRGTEEQGEILW